MNIKTGIDIVEIDRITESIDKYGEKFLNRIFTSKEIEYCEIKKVQKNQSYAGKFSAKEAVFKAISSFLDNKFELEWIDIEILNDNFGRPFVQLSDRLQKIINREISIDVSISHCKEFAISNVVLIEK